MKRPKKGNVTRAHIARLEAEAATCVALRDDMRIISARLTKAANEIAWIASLESANLDGLSTADITALYDARDLILQQQPKH